MKIVLSCNPHHKYYVRMSLINDVNNVLSVKLHYNILSG